jgi:hypothetical protein
LTSNDMFKSIALKQQKIMREKLMKDKKVREQLEQTELIALDIVKRRGGDPSKLTSSAGNVGVVSGIFSPQNNRHADMLAPCRRHDTDHVGDIALCRLLRCCVGDVSA